MPVHNEAKVEDISDVVIMPGDPLRAKYIAESFLEDVKLVNSIRAMYAYTGFYKGRRVTVMGHGMGIPSMGIYSYELFKFYDVDCIIRIGSCGAYVPELDLFDIVLADKVFSESNYCLTMDNVDCHIVESDKGLSDVIENTSKMLDIKLARGNTICTDFVDFYMDNPDELKNRIPKDLNFLSAEMEAFSLFYNAKKLGKKAACIMSVVDSKFIDTQVSPEDRQTSLNNMIKLALESSLNI